MSLTCLETVIEERILFARHDPSMFDSRVLQNLLELEERYLVSTTYFECVQRDVQPYMRKAVATWMMEICIEQRCEEEVFPLSMNYFDRYLSVAEIFRTQLQALGSACMLVASKVKETLPLTTDKLVIYTDNSVTQGELLDFELMLLMQLKWDVLSVTAIDFVDQIIHRLHLSPESNIAAKKLSNAFIHFCCTEHKFSVYTPSMIAVSCVGAAVFATVGLARHLLLEQLQEIIGVDSVYCLKYLYAVADLEQIGGHHGVVEAKCLRKMNKDILHSCLEQVEAALRSNSRQRTLHPNKGAKSPSRAQECAGSAEAMNRTSTNSAGTSMECRRSHSTPTDVDMVF